MPRMSKKRKQKWAFFLNERNRITYNPLCRKCRRTCKQSFRATIIAEYITAETTLPPPPYLPYPRFLLKMDISQTAKLLYALLSDRSALSQKNGWQDDEGRIYTVYPVAEIAEVLDKGSTTVKGALNELDAAGLLERKRAGFSAANRLYVKLPPVVQISDPMTDGNLTLISTGNRPYNGQKSDPMTVGKPSPNKTNINNLIESQTKGVSGEPPAPAYGRYGNIYLSDTEYAELQADFPDRLERLIEEMSRYRSGKPLIVTTNLTLAELQHPKDTAHTRIYDRLTEMCPPVRFTGGNFRKGKAQSKLERLKTLLTEGKENFL